MLIAIVSGNIGKDAMLRDAGSDRVCSFSVASSKKSRGGDATTWVDCSIWGKRGESLVQHLTKGKRVAVSGELSTREHNGKTYLCVKVDQLDFMGGGNGKHRDEPASQPDRSDADDSDPDF